MKKLTLLVAGLASIMLSGAAFADTHTNYDSRTGTNTMVTDPVVPNGPHWVPDTIQSGSGQAWSSTVGGYGPPAAPSLSNEVMYRRNLHDSGYNPRNDFDAGTGLMLSQ